MITRADVIAYIKKSKNKGTKEVEKAIKEMYKDFQGTTPADTEKIVADLNSYIEYNEEKEKEK